MKPFTLVVCITLFASVIACTIEPGGEADPGDLGAEVEAEAARPALAPSRGRTPPAPAAPTLTGFIDACLLPGMTKATFNATSSFDAHDEGVTAVLNLPFPFTFYGTSHTKYWFTTNGQLGFGNTLGGSLFGRASCPLPAAGFSTPIVFVYSVDLIGRLEPHAGVCYATTGTAPSRKLVVTWKDSFFYDAWVTSNVTFSATLNEGTNVIDVAIERADAPYAPDFETGFVSVLGRQAGSSGQTYSCYQPNAPEGTVVHYNP